MAAASLVDYRKSTVNAEESLFFLDTLQSASVAAGKVTGGEFHMMFLRADNSSVDTGVETETIADVTVKTQPTEVSSYAPTMSYSGNFLSEDPVCKKFEEIYRNRATGSSAHFYMVEVDTWDTNKAYITDVTVAISSITNEAGGKRRVEATIGFASDSVTVVDTVTIDSDTGVLTFS